jgi:hypothetical protein
MAPSGNCGDVLILRHRIKINGLTETREGKEKPLF